VSALLNYAENKRVAKELSEKAEKAAKAEAKLQRLQSVLNVKFAIILQEIFSQGLTLLQKLSLA
jgi:hypothetical protein